MPVELLIHAQTHTKAQKGFVQTVQDQPAIWGNRETLPNYVILEITDATKAQVDNYTDNWKNELSYELLGSDANGRRYKISVNPNIISQVSVDKGIQQRMKTYLENTYGAVLVDAAVNQQYVTFDIPNTDWVALRADLLDGFESQVDTRRYIFSPTDVDIAIAAGGRISLTAAQTLTRVVDRLV